MKNKFKSVKLRCGINATLITALFVVAVILVNLLTGILIDKFPSVNIDLTKNRQFVITDVTKDALKGINKPITFKLATYEQTTDVVIEELVSRYKQIKPDITIEKVDTAKNPTIEQKYGELDPYGTLIIECEDKYEVISFTSLYGEKYDLSEAESLITNGIVASTTGVKKTILFSEGHGELPAYGLAAIAQKNYYKYDLIDLVRTELKNENCDMLVIFAPEVDFTQQEIAAIESYVLGGGNLQIYLDPTAPYLNNLCEYIKEWGIEVKNEAIVEKNNDNIAQQGLFIPETISNGYTKNVNTDSYYEYSFKLDVLYSEMNGVTVVPVMQSSSEATTYNYLENNEGPAGQHNISLVSERVLEDNSIVKMYVSGSTLLHEYDNYMYNEKICSSVLSEMLKSENYVDVPSKSTDTQVFSINTTNLIFIIIVIGIIAIAVLIYGIVVWRKRRYL